MILLMEDLNQSRGYKLETFYLAVNIADHYLMKMAISENEAPCLVLLGTTSLLVAAKIEQPRRPCFANMIYLLQNHNVTIEKEAIASMEYSILHELNFSIRFIPSIHFLERFQRIFAIHKSDPTAKTIRNLARNFCRFMLLSSSFLQYKPSQMAAASILLGIETGFSSGVTRITSE